MTVLNKRKQAAMDLPVQVLSVQQLADVCAQLDKTGFFPKPVSISWVLAVLRAQLNLRETQHPYHHKTADGTIVEPDPTLEDMLSRLSAEQRRQFYQVYAPTLEQERQAPKAVPVNRLYYGFNPYEGLI